MGGPRASTLRQIRYGERCAVCERFIGTQGATGRERRCDECTARPHRVYAIFFCRDGWVVNFLLEDLKTSAGPIRHFRNFDTIRRIFRRVEDGKLTCGKELDQGEREGRGAFWMKLSDDELARLRR